MKRLQRSALQSYSIKHSLALPKIHLFMKKYWLLLIINFVNLIFGQNVNLQKETLNFTQKRLNSSTIIKFENAITKSPNDTSKINALYTLGKVFYKLEKYDQSFNSYSKGLTIANKIGAIQQIAKANEAIGNLQFKLGNFNKSNFLSKSNIRFRIH